MFAEQPDDSLPSFLKPDDSKLYQFRKLAATPPAKHKPTSPSTNERSEFAKKRRSASDIVEERFNGPNQKLHQHYLSNRRLRRKSEKLLLCESMVKAGADVYIHIYTYIHTYRYTYAQQTSTVHKNVYKVDVCVYIYVYQYICLIIDMFIYIDIYTYYI